MRYIAYETAKGEVFISTYRSARNMAYQGMLKQENKVNILMELVGQVSVGKMGV